MKTKPRKWVRVVSLAGMLVVLGMTAVSDMTDNQDLRAVSIYSFLVVVGFWTYDVFWAGRK